MLILSLVLFAAALLAIGVAFARGLSDVDAFLVPPDADPATPRPEPAE